LQTRLLLTCGFMFCWTYLVLSWCFSIIKINAGSFVSLQRGFKFRSCAIALSNPSKAMLCGDEECQVMVF
jgi:hypothetical protein